MKHELRFGMGPAAAAPARREPVQRFEQLLGEALGRGVRVRTADYYQDMEMHLAEDQVDVAWLPPALFVRLEVSHSLRPVVAVERAQRGGYHGVLFARADRGGDFPEGLRGSTVGWADGSSCSGYLFPRFALVERGLHPDRYFDEELILGSHEEVVQAVASKWVDVGATYARLSEDGITIERAAWDDIDSGVAMRPLLVSKPIPSDVVAGQARVVDRLGEQIAAALIRLPAMPGGEEVTRELFHAHAFGAVERHAYDVVRSALNVAHLPSLER